MKDNLRRLIVLEDKLTNYPVTGWHFDEHSVWGDGYYCIELDRKLIELKFKGEDNPDFVYYKREMGDMYYELYLTKK